MLACDVIQASARMLSKHVAVILKKYLCLLKIVMTDKVSLVFVNLHYAILRYINIYRLKMDRDSLLLFHFMYQRFRDAKKRRALNRRRRRMYLLLHQMSDYYLK